MEEFENIVSTAYWIIIGILIITILSRIFYYIKTREHRINLLEERQAYKISRFLTLLALPIFIFGITSFVFVLQRGNMFASSLMKNALLLLLVTILLTEIFYNIKVVPRKMNRVINIIFLGLIAAIGIYSTTLYTTAKSHPPIEDSIAIDLPFKGTWMAAGAGATGLTNHHDRIESQKYAVDIAKIGDNGKLFTGSGIEKEESHTYGAEILSPVNGEVVYIVDTLPDIPIQERDKLAGNHVVIEFQDSLYVALAHLQEKSIPLKKGDQVSVGDFVGKVGMSGNTDFCHLHIHIQDRAIYDLENGKTYPLRFKEFKRKRFAFWRKVENDYLLSNDIIKQ